MRNITFLLQARPPDHADMMHLHAFRLDANSRVCTPADLIRSTNNSITIDLRSVPSEISIIVFVVTLSDTQYSFSDIDAAVQMVGDDVALQRREHIVQFDTSRALRCKVVRCDRGWRCDSRGIEGCDETLDEIARHYGCDMRSTAAFPTTTTSKANPTVHIPPRRSSLPLFGKRRYVCASCFKEITTTNWFQCSKPQCKKNDGSPNKFQDNLANSDGIGTCLKCNTPTAMRLCPHEGCREKLPRHFENITTVFIGVIGAARTGKTHFLTVLIEELRTRKVSSTQKPVFEQIGLKSVRALGGTIKTFEDYFQTLYINKKTIDQTGRADITIPLRYLLERSDDSENTKDINLVFFDASGEHYAASDSTKILELHRYLGQAAGIILLLDPDNQGSPDQRQLLDKLIENLEDIGSQTKSIPLATVLSKADQRAEFMSLVNAEDAVYLHNWNRHSNTIRDWFGADGRIVNVRAFHHDFFAVSALGKAPIRSQDYLGRDDVDSIPGGPSPIHVLNPLLWILSEQHLI